MQMQRKDDSYYASLNTDIARLSVETVETTETAETTEVQTTAANQRGKKR